MSIYDEVYDLPDDPIIAEFISYVLRGVDKKVNPNFGPFYDTTSGVQFRLRDIIAYGTVERAKVAPLIVGGAALLQPVVNSEVSSTGGAQTFHATPGVGGGLLGFFGNLFGWDD